MRISVLLFAVLLASVAAKHDQKAEDAVELTFSSDGLGVTGLSRRIHAVQSDVDMQRRVVSHDEYPLRAVDVLKRDTRYLDAVDQAVSKRNTFASSNVLVEFTAGSRALTAAEQAAVLAARDEVTSFVCMDPANPVELDISFRANPGAFPLNVNVFYAANTLNGDAVANSLAKQGVGPLPPVGTFVADLEIFLDDSVTWTTSGTPGVGEFDVFSAVLKGFAAGLGIDGFFEQLDGSTPSGLTSTYDDLLEDGVGGTRLVDANSAQFQLIVTGGNVNFPAVHSMESSSPFVTGEQNCDLYSFVDNTRAGNDVLLEPGLPDNMAFSTLGTETRQILVNLGWVIPPLVSELGGPPPSTTSTASATPSATPSTSPPPSPPPSPGASASNSPPPGVTPSPTQTPVIIPFIDFCAAQQTSVTGGFMCPGYNGSNNHPMGLGIAGNNLLRVVPSAYTADPVTGNINFPPRASGPNERDLSNQIVRQREEGDPANKRGLSDFTTIWGQFIDHDLALTPELELSMAQEPYADCVPDIECGDGICGPTEDATSCNVDCPAGCGDSICFPGSGEDECTCARDCAPEFNEVIASVRVRNGDPQFDQFFSNSRFIEAERSIFDPTMEASGRQQPNLNSAFIDGSVVYGSSLERANALRLFSGGMLRTSDQAPFGVFPPLNGDGMIFLENDNNERDEEDLFVAGDVRANEQPALLGLHTLFVREHNFQAQRIAACDINLNPLDPMDDEEIFQRARRYVMSEIQKITYEDFLPALMGPNPLPNYRGYDPTVNPQVSNIFQHGTFRFGHSLINPFILRLTNTGDQSLSGPIALGESFFRPETVLEMDSLGNGGFDTIWRGMAVQTAREMDSQITDALRVMLFGPPLNDLSLDLAALNIARGRDHGLPDYNTVREAFGLEPICQFSDIADDPETVLDLFTAYDGDVSGIDPWIGVISEDHVRGSLGELAAEVVIDQFSRSRDGDQYHYLSPGQLPLTELLAIQGTTLGDIIIRNSNVGCLPENVFFADPDFDFNC